MYCNLKKVFSIQYPQWNGSISEFVGWQRKQDLSVAVRGHSVPGLRVNVYLHPLIPSRTSVWVGYHQLKYTGHMITHRSHDHTQSHDHTHAIWSHTGHMITYRSHDHTRHMIMHTGHMISHTGHMISHRSLDHTHRSHDHTYATWSHICHRSPDHTYTGHLITQVTWYHKQVTWSRHWLQKMPKIGLKYFSLW